MLNCHHTKNEIIHLLVLFSHNMTGLCFLRSSIRSMKFINIFFLMYWNLRKKGKVWPKNCLFSALIHKRQRCCKNIYKNMKPITCSTYIKKPQSQRAASNDIWHTTQYKKNDVPFELYVYNNKYGNHAYMVNFFILFWWVNSLSTKFISRALFLSFIQELICMPRWW